MDSNFNSRSTNYDFVLSKIDLIKESKVDLIKQTTTFIVRYQTHILLWRNVFSQ